MPVHPEKIKGVWRQVDQEGQIALTKLGNPVDGGGTEDQAKAERFSDHFNEGELKAQAKRT